AQKLECEQILLASPLETLAVRGSIVLGRGTDNRLQEAMAMRRHVSARGKTYPWQLVHHDDIARFLALAVEPGRPTGIVNVAGEGSISQTDLAATLRRGSIRVPREAMLGVAKAAGGLLNISAGEAATALAMPVMDTTRMTSEFGFEPAWNAAETARDTLLAVHGRKGRTGRVATARGHVPYRHQILQADVPPPDGHELTSLESAHRGEFDTPIDPRFPVYSMTNLAEALPGPSTPLTIDLMARALRGTTSAVADMLVLPDALHVEASARLQGLFGHRFYINASGTYQVGIAMPGTDGEELIDQYAGRHSHEMPGGREAISGTYVTPAASRVSSVNRLKDVGLNVITAMRTAPSEVDRVTEEIARLESYVEDPAALSDARLEDTLLLARDLMAYAWTLQGIVNLCAGAALTMATKKADSHAVGQGEDLASSAALRGVRSLGRSVAASPSVAAILTEGGPGMTAQLEREEPKFWADVRAALDSFGHRGPGEAEFDGRPFADDVDGFLRTVLRASKSVRSQEESAAPVTTSRAVVRAQKMLALRERNRDRCVRLTWVTRRLALERGRRLVATDVIDAPDDVYYLTLDALLTPPDDVRATVARRRADRERLGELHMPPIFNATWDAGDAGDRLGVGEALEGLGISGGVVQGRVRIVDPDSVDDFEDDEVLVAHVTDVGYTPLFALAGAVITDIGGEMSHAAVVAREFGVPCIVDTQVAATRLRDGDLVEVDGRAGTVTLLEHAPAADTADSL
ncbi:MAG: hypothetical protein JWP31_2727, partial [Aeromicrobium sp.]|nr:hypothetical protein [Aeromicrobium sp.]